MKMSQAGLSIIEVVVAIAIMSIIMAGMASLGLSLVNENKALQQKLESIELEQALNRYLFDVQSCSCMFRDIVWDDSKPMEITSLKKGCDTTSSLPLISKDHPLDENSNGLIISEISLQNAVNIGGDNRAADLVVRFDPKTLVRPLRPLRVRSQTFTLSAGNINGCMGIAGGETLCVGLGGTWSSGSCELLPKADTLCKTLGGAIKSGACDLPTTPAVGGVWAPHIGKSIHCGSGAGSMVYARVLEDGTAQMGVDQFGSIHWQSTTYLRVGGTAWSSNTATLTTSGLMIQGTQDAPGNADNAPVPYNCFAGWP